jgi:hypothetical protein
MVVVMTTTMTMITEVTDIVTWNPNQGENFDLMQVTSLEVTPHKTRSVF